MSSPAGAGGPPRPLRGRACRDRRIHAVLARSSSSGVPWIPAASRARDRRRGCRVRSRAGTSSTRPCDAQAEARLAACSACVIPPHEALGILAREVRALEARRLGLPRRDEQHVAVAEQGISAPAPSMIVRTVDLRGHAEGDAAGEVRLDGKPDDHVHVRSLRGEDADGCRSLVLFGRAWRSVFRLRPAPSS